MIVLYVAGTPRPQPRARHLPGGQVVSTTGVLAKAWKAALDREARCVRRDHEGSVQALEGLPLAVDHVFWFATSDSGRWGQAHTAKPDRDNLDKMVLDTIRQAGLLPSDDCYVADGRIIKLWSERPALMTTIRAWGTDPASIAEITGKHEEDMTDEDAGVKDLGIEEPRYWMGDDLCGWLRSDKP